MSFVKTVGAFSVLALSASFSTSVAAAEPPIEFAQGNGKVTVAIDGLPFAVYYYRDGTIKRPYFAHVRAPNGIQVTRHHPPIEGQDVMDHGTFHPGIWMSFGDISGSDYWRIMAPVRHAEFVEKPEGGTGKGTFAVRNKYVDQKDPSKVVCDEVARYTFLARPEGYLILWDSTFSSDHEFVFGDQEEMGLGFRVATPLRVEKESEKYLPPGNGTILDSKGRKNGDQVGGNTADWCDYSGTLAGQRVGITLFCHPENFRPSWFHARDYGLLEANPFGREAFGKGEKSSIVITPGDKMRLRYGLLIHSGETGSTVDAAAAFTDYVTLTN
jgi:hypothetical protein